jgi:phosphatidate cytidylyltransferase
MNMREGKKKMESNLKSRIKVAIPGAAVFLLLIIFGGAFGAVIISAVLSALMLWEFGHIVFELPDALEKRRFLVGLGWFIPFATFLLPSAENPLLLISFFLFMFYFLYTAERFSGDEMKRHYAEMMAAFFGVFYLSFLMTYLVDLRQVAQGKHWTLLFFFVIWATDIGAYFVGLRYGRRKLYPHISPKKTWEGFFGGIGLALIVTISYKLIFFKSLSWGAVILVPPVMGVVGGVGDLAESFLKRAYGKKDSSQLLSGHGGFLDRFDSVVLGLPVMFALTRIFGVFER